MKTFEKCMLTGFIITVLLNLTVFSAKCENISEKILRLHILANSDSEEDQSLKLKVRDAVLERTSELFLNADDKTEAKSLSIESIDMIKKIAKDELLLNGCDYDVEVEVANMHFNTRRYGDVTLPAGNYDAVRILIGEAKGKNWWCVMFPAMCVPAAQDSKKLSDVLTASEVEVAENESEYEIGFKIVEYFETVKTFFMDYAMI